MLQIPILRQGRPYESIDKVEIVHHATGKPVALVSQANGGMIVRDVNRMADDVLEQFSVGQLVEMCRKAAELFASATLPVGDHPQSFDNYVGQLSATTGMPITYCKANAEKIGRVLADMETIVAGLTRGFDLEILDRGYGTYETIPTGPASWLATSKLACQSVPQTESGPHTKAVSHTLSFFREGRIFGAVLPSNSPGVHGLWIPAVALKAPIVLKPGREEPWTPYRIIEALAAAGVPREAFGFYPTDHAGAAELLRSVDRSMLFGAGPTTAPYENDPTVEIHGPGLSKVLLDDDAADDWERYLDLIESSIVANCGRSCISASGVWTPRHGKAIAEALAERLAKVEALPANDPDASVAAFANPALAEQISAVIDNDLRVEGAVDLTEQFRNDKADTARAVAAAPRAGRSPRPPQGVDATARGSSRLVKQDGCSYVLPTIVWCEDRGHPLANREFLFPYASVVECQTDQMPYAIGRTLVVSAITQDEAFIRSLMASANVDRLNIGPIPTWQISWDQPHEGNLFEHLYRQRAFQTESTA